MDPRRVAPDERRRHRGPVRYNPLAMNMTTLMSSLRRVVRHALLPLAFLLAVPLAALAGEEEVRKLVEAKFPGTKIASIVKSPYGGFYEVFLDNRIFYTDEQVSFMLVGQLIDTKTNANITELRFRKLTALNLKDLPPLSMAIKKVKGNGKRTLMVFTDPMCPFCKGLEKELEKVTNVSIYVFMYPIESKFPGTTVLSNSIWCSSDRAKAWDDWMLRGITPTASSKACKTPVAELEKIGGRLGITVTPTLIFADGAPIAGAIRAQDIDRYLDQTPAK
jgi:thiol:disulfide interchange protein DsbC